MDRGIGCRRGRENNHKNFRGTRVDGNLFSTLLDKMPKRSDINVYSIYYIYLVYTVGMSAACVVNSSLMNSLRFRSLAVILMHNKRLQMMQKTIFNRNELMIAMSEREREGVREGGRERENEK